MTAIQLVEPAPETRLAVLGVPEQFRELVDSFVAQVERQDIDWVVTADESATCGVYLADGTDLPCLVVAEDVEGNFACIDTAGRLHSFSIDEVQ